MKQLFRKLTAVFLSASVLMIHAGAEGSQEELGAAASGYTEQVTAETDNTLSGQDIAAADETAADKPETDIAVTDGEEPADTAQTEPDNAADEERDEYLRRSITEKTESAIAVSNGVDSCAVELTVEEIEYIERMKSVSDSEGNRRVSEPANLGGSLSEYANDYFLDLMTTEERALYTGLFNVCQEFARSTTDAETEYVGTFAYYDPGAIPAARVKSIYNMFYYSNPQFYFLQNGFSYNTSVGRITPLLYSDFRSASFRSRYSSAIASATEELIPVIMNERTELAKQKAIYMYICRNTTYQDSPYDQSIASTFVDHYSVCNGYALTTEYLCNAVGIDCIVAVGNGHAWNIVNIGGTWYELDVTWMDTDKNDRINLKWRNKSHDTFLANDSNQYHVYNKDKEYSYFTLPLCNVDMYLEDENYVIDSTGKFYQYNGDLTDIVIPGDLGITSVCYSSFYNNTFVKSVIIPEGIVGIGDAAFAMSSALEFVSIPTSVTSIGVQAFYGSSITDIYYAGSPEQWAAINVGRMAFPDNIAIHFYSAPPSAGIEIGYDTFPDKIFRAFVSENYDLNGDGFLSDAEIAAVTDIDVSYTDIIGPRYGTRLWSVAGIEYFTALTSLDLSGNDVSELDLSGNTALVTLNCSFNALEKLDLTRNIALKNLSCGFNKLTSLDLDRNTNLTGLNCNGNTYDIGELRDSYDLSRIPGFPAARTSEWAGAYYNADNNTLTDFTADTITYKYDCGNGFKKIFTLTCSFILPQPVSIRVTAPSTTEYFLGQDIDPDGGIVTVNYDFGDPVEIVMTADMLSGYDNTTAGKQNVTVTYEGFTATFEVTFKEASVTGITATAPTKTTYFVGEAIDPDGGIVTVNYDFGDPVEIAMTADMLIGYDNTTAGVQRVTVTYEGFTATFEVTFKEASITGITATAPTKTTYFVGEAIDPTGGIVTVNYNFGDPVEIAMTADMLSGYDNTTTGDQRVTVTYEGFTATFEVTFKEASVTGITATAPTKTTYFVGEAIDPDGGIVTVNYDFGDPVEIAMTADMLSGYDNTTAGDQRVTVTYEGFTATFEVTFKEASITGITATAPTKTTYFVGEAIDPTGGIVTVNYDFGDPVEIAMTADMLSGYNMTSAGAKTVIVTYEGSTATFEVTVNERIIQITVTATPGDSEVTLTWDAVDGAAKYAAYLVQVDGTLKALATKLTDTTYTAANLTNGTEYTFLVRAYVNSKWSKYSANDYVKATPVSTVVKPEVTATPSDEQITLTWNAVPDAAKYAVYIVQDDNTLKALATKLTDTTYTAKKLTNGTEYSFLVRAYVNGKWTKYDATDYVKATPFSTIVKPTVEVIPADKQVTLTWDAIDGATKYAVYRLQDDGTLKALATKLTVTEYTVKKLVNHTEYQFLVRAYVNGKWTKYDANDYVSATPAALKPLVQVSEYDGMVTLRWGAVDDATKYAAYIVNDDGSLTCVSSKITNIKYTVKKLTNGTAYRFVVRAYVNGKWTKYTDRDIVTATPHA